MSENAVKESGVVLTPCDIGRYITERALNFWERENSSERVISKAMDISSGAGVFLQFLNENKNIPLVKSQQVNMRLDSDSLNKAQVLAKLQGLPYTTFLTQLISEDLERLWIIYLKAKKKGI